jgi:hypothetical protein
MHRDLFELTMAYKESVSNNKWEVGSELVRWDFTILNLLKNEKE